MINLRLRTNAEIEQKLVELQTGLQLSSKAAVMRLSIGVALSNEKVTLNDIKNHFVKSEISEHTGGDYLRFTIFPSDEMIYKLMIEEHLQEFIEDNDFFPNIVNAYISIGVTILYSNYKLLKNKDKLYGRILSGGLE
jgi:hypothetical protein